jgi:hypothetical protein
MTTMQQEEQQVTHIITVTECLTEPCAIYYTDTLSQSLLVICKNKKHVDLVPLDRDTDIDIEKRVKAGVSLTPDRTQEIQQSCRKLYQNEDTQRF